jgi:hypothetical protein
LLGLTIGVGNLPLLLSAEPSKASW